MAAAMSRDTAGGVSASASPTSTRVGHAIAASVGREFEPRHDRRHLAQKGLRPGFFGHDAHQGFEGRVAVTVGVNQSRELAVGNLGKTSGCSHFDERQTRLCLRRDFGPRRGIEKREPRHPLRRLPHDLESDVTAHRQPNQREPWRRRGKRPACDRCDAVVARVIGDNHRPEPPKRRNLVGIKPRRAVEPRHEHARHEIKRPLCFCHLLFTTRRENEVISFNLASLSG